MITGVCRYSPPSLPLKQGSVPGVEMFKTIDGDLCFCKQNNDLFIVSLCEAVKVTVVYCARLCVSTHNTVEGPKQ